ncbi:MAG: hypothetical protein P8Y97_19110 [Candidatus Lokiarchaeota archaeon]
MTEEKNTINVIDGTINAVHDIIHKLEIAKQELVTLEKDKAKLSNEAKLLEKEKEQLENEKNKLEAEKQKLETDKKTLELEKTKLEEATKQLEKEKAERDQKIGDLTSEQMKLLDEYEKLKEELKKLSQIVEDQEESEFSFERMKALLSISMVLLEEIWQGQPHFRILLTLHGEKEEMTREQIKNTTGISGAMVLRAVHELDKIDLIEYNEDTGMVKLKKRLFKKEDLEKKNED